MLDASEVAEFRERVERAQRGRIVGPWRWARLEGGPLALSVRVSAPVVEAGGSVGWCTPTRCGPVVATYRWAGDGWTFDRFDAPGRRESGALSRRG